MAKSKSGIFVAFILVILSIFIVWCIIFSPSPSNKDVVTTFDKYQKIYKDNSKLIEIPNAPEGIRCFRLMWTNGTQVVAAEGISCFPKQ